jgi:type I restriction-modification system DNA methylase subunit
MGKAIASICQIEFGGLEDQKGDEGEHMSKFDVETVNQLIGVKESYQAPDALMAILWNRPKRETLFSNFLDISTDLREDWFREYFQDVQADRKQKKQDFTAQSIINMMVGISGKGHDYYEVAAGTGGIAVTQWYEDRNRYSPFSYRPSLFLYQLEELSEAALPFLLFNLLIRGMDATVVHGDSIERTAWQVYFIQNDADDYMSFSSLNVMPHTDDAQRMFEIKKWLEPAKEHIESTDAPKAVNRAMRKLKGGKKWRVN